MLRRGDGVLASKGEVARVTRCTTIGVQEKNAAQAFFKEAAAA